MLLCKAAGSAFQFVVQSTFGVTSLKRMRLVVTPPVIRAIRATAVKDPAAIMRLGCLSIYVDSEAVHFLRLLDQFWSSRLCILFLAIGLASFIRYEHELDGEFDPQTGRQSCPAQLSPLLHLRRMSGEPLFARGDKCALDHRVRRLW